MHRHEIISVLGQYIRFKEQSTDEDNVEGFCPFHKGGQEKSPSMYVYVGPPKKGKAPGTTFCHTCDRGWSLRGLLKDLGVTTGSMPELELLLEEVGPVRESVDKGIEFEFSVLPEQILGVFSYVPKQMLRWGFDPPLIRRHEIGFDRDRKRIIFPIRNHEGDLVGLSGRTVRGEVPRYKIYKKELWEVQHGFELKKGQVVWGLDKLYRDYMDGVIDKPLVVCEGFKACLWVQQAGFAESVALLGSYLTKAQRYLLERTTTEVILFLDNDEAGRNGTKKIIEMDPGFYTRIAKYPTDEPISPDDLTIEQVKKAIEGAEHSALWRLNNVKQSRFR